MYLSVKMDSKAFQAASAAYHTAESVVEWDKVNEKEKLVVYHIVEALINGTRKPTCRRDRCAIVVYTIVKLWI